MRITRLIVIAMIAAFVLNASGAYAANKARVAVAPYAQTDDSSTYSFIGITHPSLATAVTQIGLTIATNGFAGAAASKSFTIDAGETYRIFVVSTNHSTVNSDTLTDSNIQFLAGTTSSTNGSIIVTSSFTNPGIQAPQSVAAVRPFKYGGLDQLIMWGAIVVPSTSTGFAMEFIGDAHDSNFIGSTIRAEGVTATIPSGVVSGGTHTGRGVN